MKSLSDKVSGINLAILGLLAFAMFGSQLLSQTLFEWPASNANVAVYKDFYKCFAASIRVRDSLHRRDPVLEDTLTWKSQQSIFATHPLIVDVTERCIENMDPASVAPEQYWVAMELYLLSKKYDIAEQLVNRRLNVIPEEDTLQRAWFLDSVISRYAGTRPRLLEGMDKYAMQVSEIAAGIPFKLHAEVYYRLFQAADIMERQDKVKKYGERVLEIISDADKTQLSSGEIEPFAYGVYTIIRRLRHTELIDSLKTGTKNYANFLDESMREVLQERPDNKIGEKLPKLEGDFWFPSSAGRSSYPQLGKISLVYFTEVAAVVGPRSLAQFAVLRRLQAKFPTLEIIVVAATKGYFGVGDPLDPESEANLINDLGTNLYKVPGVLTVTNRPTITVENPDGRVLNQLIPNALNYPGSAGSQKTGNLYLADESGLLIVSLPVQVRAEELLYDLIQGLIDRNSASNR